MTKDQALKLALAYVNERKLPVGDLKGVELMPVKARPEAAPKGDLWRIYFKDPTIPADVIQDPDVIVIHVEDSTGETSEFYAM